MSEYSRPASGFRFKSKGIKTNAAPDALAEHEYVVAENTRSYAEDEIQSRPQMAQSTQAPNDVSAPILSLEPAIGVYKIGTSIYHDAVEFDTDYSTRGASITPFRPNASPLAWDYVWDDLKSTKVNVNEVNSVTVQKTGIAEPLVPVDAATYQAYVTPLTPVDAVDFGAYGTAFIQPMGVKVVDEVAGVFQDPALPSGSLNEYIIQTLYSTGTAYQAGQTVDIATHGFLIREVFQPLTSIQTIQAIYYYAGSTGRCVIVPANIGQSQVYSDEGPGVFEQTILGSLKRGALMSVGSEICMILGTAVGVDGTISFETTTTGTYTAGDTFTTVLAFRCYESYEPSGAPPVAPSIGDLIHSANAEFGVTAGIGGISSHLAITNPFTYAGISYQDSDFIHLSIRFQYLSAVNEVQVLMDCSSDGVGEGILNNYYYFSVRPADILANISNASTGLAAANISAQNQQTDEEAAKAGRVPSSQQLSAGNNQWSDIYVPIKSLIRVGSDTTLSLLNLNALYIQVNANSTTGVGFQTLDVAGGFSPDVTGSAQGIEYIIRPRSTATGAKGNPSPRMRYTVNPKRELIKVITPTTYADPQVDVWDIFRRGGTIEQFTLTGTIPLTTGFFLDNYSDTAIINNPQIEYDLLEPFPSIGPPITGTANSVGTTLVCTFLSTSPVSDGTLSQIGALLPGNLINIGQQTYTLWTRPTFISSGGGNQIWLFQLQENAGSGTGLSAIIYQPLLAAQSNAQVWGPDADGVFFAVGDPLRPGFVVRTNPNNPDASSDKNTTDLCPPTEPLQNGALISGTSIAFSTSRAWRGFPQGGGVYKWNEIPVGRGLAARFAICTNGHQIFYVAKDGIRRTSGGDSASMTDANLYNLFPHEGVTQPANIVYAGHTIYAPDYSRADFFRLATANGFLYFDYLDSTGAYRTLVCQIATEAWSVDIYAHPLSIHAPTTTPSEVDDAIEQQLFGGGTNGAIYTELSTPSGAGEAVVCALAMREETYGDIRATKLFGDAMIDAAVPSGLTATPISFGIPQTATVLAPQIRLPQPSLLDLGGQLEARALGCLFTWTDVGVTTILYAFQLSYIVQPAVTDNRFQDWDDAGYEGAKWFQGFLLEASTDGANKVLTIRDSDTLTTHAFDSTNGASTINHADQSIRAYSFTTPFIAHMVRYEPDEVPWKTWEIKWIFEPTPESTFTWWVQPTSHSLAGWQHLRPNQLIAHRSTADLTLTITADGVPHSYVIPNSGGAFVKTLVPLRAIKALVWQYKIVSTAPFSLWLEDQEMYTGEWGRSGPYTNVRLLGSNMGNKALV